MLQEITSIFHKLEKTNKLALFGKSKLTIFLRKYIQYKKVDGTMHHLQFALRFVSHVIHVTLQLKCLTYPSEKFYINKK